MTYSVAVVGCGVIGKRLGQAIADHPDTSLDYAVDKDTTVLEQYCEVFDCKGFTNYQDILTIDEVDIVYVGIPPKFHKQAAIDALQAGKHVICEKPIALSAEDGNEMAKVAREQSRATAINFPFNYSPSFQKLRSMIAQNELGEIDEITIRIRFPRWPRKWQDVEWLKTHEQGGPLREVGSHFIYAVQDLFGTLEVQDVDLKLTAPEEFEKEIHASFLVNGKPGTIDLITGNDEKEENTLYITGTEMTIRFRDWYILEKETEDGWEIVDKSTSNSSYQLITAFVQTIDTDTNSIVSFETASKVQKVIDTIFNS